MNKTQNTKNKNNKKLGLIALISGFCFLLIAVQIFNSELPNKNNIVKISGILENDIRIKRRNRGSKSLTINLKKYPEINFMIGNVSLRQTYDNELINDNKAGGYIEFFIEDRDFRRKILKKEKIPFPENILHADKISIVEIKNNTSSYLLLEDYNRAHLKNNYIGTTFFGLVGMLAFILGMIGMNNEKNTRSY